ncbi:MAG: hypothetical protein GY705_24100 [Bacteroidetes bacterium]|nr:hypothetical protein [Bacteroidota bacterium]
MILKKTLFIFFFLILLIISSCVSDPKTFTERDTLEVQLLCESISEEEPEPMYAIYFLVKDQKLKLADSFSCTNIEPSDYHEYQIPSKALDAANGWWAGSGNCYYIVRDSASNTLLVKFGWMEEMQANPSFQYETLATYKMGEFELFEL